MNKFQPQKLSVTYIPPATANEPIDSRKYTLTHSDDTGELFLSIGYTYDYHAINFTIRDEVLAEWMTRNGEYLLLGKAYISSGDFDQNMARIRYMIFKREMDLALTGIIYGDREFYMYYPWLLDAPIYVQFASIYPEFNTLEYFGTPRKYLQLANRNKTPETQA